MPWLSWLVDLAGPAAAEDAGEWRCRVYGHRTKTSADLEAQRREYAWMSTEQLKEAVTDNKLTDGADILKWLHMWQNEKTRMANRSPAVLAFRPRMAYFKYNGNGNPEGTYLVGEFDEWAPNAGGSLSRSLSVKEPYIRSRATPFGFGVGFLRCSLPFLQ